MRAPTRTPEGQLIRSILNETSELTQPHLPIDPGLVGDLLNGILGDKIELIAQSRQEALSGFNNRLRERWESPLNKLEFLLILSSEIGSYTFIERLPEKEQNLDPRYHAMNELHSRAIQVGYEIITLLSNGHADGALARWRSLHETAVYSHFILKSDPSIGSRFIDYKLLEQIQLIEENEKHSGDSIDTDLREEYDQLKQLLVEKYGKPFDDGGYGYGWAAEEFDNKSASFRRIEEKSGLDIYHPAYVLANNNVHSGSIGSQWHIGVMDTDNRDLPNVTGPTNYGLTLPGELTSASLYEVTTASVLLNPSSEKIAALENLHSLQNAISEAFNEVKAEIKEDESRLSKNPNKI